MMSTNTQPIARQHITSTPGVCGGRPCILGTRIRVQDIYIWHELDGRSVEEIVHDFPQLTPADVHAALAWFWDNRDAILDDLRKTDALAARLKAQTLSHLSHPQEHGAEVPS